MQSYLNMLLHVLQNGKRREDRTGTGTIGVFGYEFRHQMADGFPLLTTKKLHTKSIIHELLWFLRGDTNVKYLRDNGVTIWDEWADGNGELGPVYGFNWRKWGAIPDSIIAPKPNLRAGIERTYLGVANGQGKSASPVGKTWEGMISRCYNPQDVGYSDYGGRGVHVCDRWMEFRAFERDVQDLPGWEFKIISDREYVLDKDGIGNGFMYSPETCQWITAKANQAMKNNKRYKVESVETGITYEFSNPSDFCEERGIPNNNFSDLWTGRKNANIRNGFRLVSVEDASKGVDQIKELVRGLRENPYSRRHVVSAWNPTWTEFMALPPCHMLFQCYVEDQPYGPKQLSLRLDQRSADLFLGVPFNIASYALLLEMLAHVTGMIPGELVIHFGDLHIYSNHLDQVQEQLSRKPMALPYLQIVRRVEEIDDFRFDDFRIAQYFPHPAIKAPIAV